MKRLIAVAILTGIILMAGGIACAAGPFGPPQPMTKETGGLRTAVGVWFQEDQFKNGTEHVFRQNQVYSEAAYGARNTWEVYGRIGISDLKIFDAFASQQPATTSSKNDFEENWKFFGTLGAKGFYPFNSTFGIGAFVQGTYFFRSLMDEVSGVRNGVPYTIELEIKHLWDVYSGLGFQIAAPLGAKLYLGPYVYYTEAQASPSTSVPGLNLTAGDTTLRNKSAVGGFAGIDLPLARGFHLNLEGQYSERLSGGLAITYIY